MPILPYAHTLPVSPLKIASCLSPNFSNFFPAFYSLPHDILHTPYSSSSPLSQKQVKLHELA